MSVTEPLLMAPRRIGVCRGIVGIKPQCFVEKLQRLVTISGRIRYRVRQSAEIEVVGVELVGPLASSAFDLSAADRRLDCADNALRHPILQVEDVFQGALELTGPDMCPGLSFDELAGDTEPVRGLPNATLQHVVNAEFSGDLPDVDRL